MISEALSGLAAAIIGPGEPRAARVTEDGLGMVEYIMEVPHALPHAACRPPQGSTLALARRAHTALLHSASL